MQDIKQDTICALSSASGKAGVAVVRISGAHAIDVLAHLSISGALEPRKAVLRTLISPISQRPIDRALVLPFPAPHSFTGEDVVELHVHGSRAVVAELLEVLTQHCGVRPALPGEFTQRAFDKGKMDLLEVEALADLLDSETAQQKAMAMQGLDGVHSQRIIAVRGAIVHAMAMLEAYIDFPDEEIPDSALADVFSAIDQAKDKLTSWRDHMQTVAAIRDGIRVAIIGCPNAGKSTLLNALSARDAAIISDVAGTTRDVIEVRADIGGHLVILSDTAGIRAESSNEIEQEGMARSMAAAQDAHLCLYLHDASAQDAPLDLAGLGTEIVHVYNKLDTKNAKHPDGALCISAKNGQGLDELLALLTQWCEEHFGYSEDAVVVRIRQESHILEAISALDRAKNDLELELLAELLRAAAKSLSAMLGEVTADELLGEIFSSFCIGK